jgi:translocator protein
VDDCVRELLAAALLEGVFAGPEVRRQLREIRMPRFAPPFWGWIVIGVAYYAITFSILIRVLLLPAGTDKTVALVLLAAVLFLNAFWNLWFFRLRRLGIALVVSLVYSGLSLGLFFVLWFADRPTGIIYLPYVLYLAYANTFGYRVWMLNE